MASEPLTTQIISDLLDPKMSLTVPLMKTQVFAAQSGNAQLGYWVKCESNGYGSTDSIPEYRRYQAHVTMDYGVLSQRHYRQPVQATMLPVEEAKKLFVAELPDSVAALESMGNPAGAPLLCPVTADQKRRIQEVIRASARPGNYNGRVTVIAVYKALSSVVPIEILQNVRQKLLDFILTVEAEYGQVTDITQLKKYAHNITNIMNTTIHNSGIGAVINTGNNATVTANNQINICSKQELAEHLRQQAVSEPDIEELMTVIDQQPADPSTGRYSQPVRDWFAKMMVKALDGTWTIAAGAAGNVLGDLINAYYGIGK